MSKRFSELIKERQSCRKFSEKALDKKLLYEIIDAARIAPSANNLQPWRVCVSYTAEENEKIKNCLQDGDRNKFLDRAKAFVAVYETEGNVALSRFSEYDVGEFVAYLTLAAKDRGVDSCIIGWVNNEKLNQTLALNGKCNIVVALGYGDHDSVRQKSRLALKDIIVNYED